MVAVDQAIVDFVRDHQQIPACGQVRNGREQRAVQDSARRIVGKAQHQRLGTGCQALFDICYRDLKVVLHRGWQGHRHASGHLHRSRKTHKTGLGYDDLVARVQNGVKGQLGGFADPDGDQDFGDGVIRRTIIQPTPMRQNRFPQFQEAGIVRIGSVSGPQGPHTRLHYRSGRDKIGFAYAQADDVIHRGRDLEEAPDGGCRQGGRPGTDPGPGHRTVGGAWGCRLGFVDLGIHGCACSRQG